MLSERLKDLGSKLLRLLGSLEFMFALYLYPTVWKGLPMAKIFIIDATVATGGIVFLGSCVILWRRGLTLRRSSLPVLAFGACFLFWVILSSSWSSSSAAPLRAYQQAPLSLLALFVASCVIAPDRRRVRRFIASYFALAALVFWETLMIFKSQGVFGLLYGARDEASNYIIRGVVLSLAVAITAAAAMERVNQGKRWGGLVVLIGIFALGVAVTGSRQAMLATGLTLVGLIVWSLQPRRQDVVRIHRAALAPLTSVAAGAALLLAMSAAGFQPGAITRLVLSVTNPKAVSVDVRETALARTWNTWDERPILGHGAASYGPRYGFFASDHPHNMIVESLFDYGMVGLCLLLGLLGMSLLPGRSLWHARDGYVPRALTLCFLIAVFGGLFSYCVVDNRALYALAGLAGAFVVRHQTASMTIASPSLPEPEVTG